MQPTCKKTRINSNDYFCVHQNNMGLFTKLHKIFNNKKVQHSKNTLTNFFEGFINDLKDKCWTICRWSVTPIIEKVVFRPKGPPVPIKGCCFNWRLHSYTGARTICPVWWLLPCTYIQTYIYTFIHLTPLNPLSIHPAARPDGKITFGPQGPICCSRKLNPSAWARTKPPVGGMKYHIGKFYFFLDIWRKK